MDAVILNYRAGRLQQFASAMRDRFTQRYARSFYRREGQIRDRFHGRRLAGGQC